MRVTTTLAAIGILSAAFMFLAPAVGALDIGCVRADANGSIEVTTLPAGSATLFTPPGSDVTGWTPECVIIPNGGLVTFAQRDAIGHGVISDNECIDLGVMSTVGGTPAAPSSSAVTSLKVDFDPMEGLAFLTQNGDELNLCSFEVQENVLLIPYHCIIHGQGMPGTIKVEL